MTTSGLAFLFLVLLTGFKGGHSNETWDNLDDSSRLVQVLIDAANSKGLTWWTKLCPSCAPYHFLKLGMIWYDIPFSRLWQICLYSTTQHIEKNRNLDEKWNGLKLGYQNKQWCTVGFCFPDLKWLQMDTQVCWSPIGQPVLRNFIIFTASEQFWRMLPTSPNSELVWLAFLVDVDKHI